MQAPLDSEQDPSLEATGVERPAAGVPGRDVKSSTAAASRASMAPSLPLSGGVRALLQESLLAWLFFLGVAILVTWPMVLTLQTQVLGDPANDVWNHLWGYWWVKDSLLNHHQLPVATDLLNHPRGGTLFFIDLSNALFSLPLQLLFGLVASYNLTLLFHLTLNGFGAWLLARHLTRNPVASLVAGVIYGFSPHLLAQIHNGISETINAGWLPIFLLFYLKTFQEARLYNALLAGLALFMTTFSNWYYGLFGLLVVSIHLLTQLGASWRRLISPGLLGRLVLMGVSYGVLVAPLMGLLSYTLSAKDAIVGRAPEFVYQTLIRHNMTDLLIFFHTGQFRSPDLKARYGEDLIIVGYLGYSALLLAALPFLQRRSREVRLWAILGVTFFIFALGPFLYVNGAYVELQGRWIPLPFLLFFHAFPLFSRISHAFRFVIMVSLTLGILAAYGLKGLQARSGRAVALLGTLAICALVLAETFYLSPAPWPLVRSEVKSPSYYQLLADEPGSFAVLDLPIGVPTLKRAIYTFGQTVHGKKIPYGLNDPFPQTLLGNRFISYLVNLEFLKMEMLPLMLPDLDILAGIEQLKAQQYRYILVHDDLFFTASQASRVHRVLSWYLGDPERYPGDHLSVYRLE